MMHVPEAFRLRSGPMASTAALGNNGAFLVPLGTRYAQVIASDGEGWEHVSVSLQDRCPTWDEMCKIKDLFWDDEDVAVQFHPAKSQYVNNHPYCLHLWRPTDQPMPTPRTGLIGIVGKRLKTRSWRRA